VITVLAAATSPSWAGLAFIWLACILVAATAVRRTVRPLAALFIPTAVIAGFLILLIGPQMLGEWTDSDGVIPLEVLDVWATLPGLLINVVFAAVMLGKRLPPLRSIWTTSAPHVILGSVFSFGQFALGSFVVVLLLEPVFDLNPLAGSLLELSFAGGHGTMAGMGPLLTAEGAGELVDLGIGLATVSMVTGIIIGSLLIRFALSRPDIPVARESRPTRNEPLDLDQVRVANEDRVESTATAGGENRGMGPVTAGFAAIGVSIAVAIVLLEAIRFVVGALGSEVFESFPLFPFAVIGGYLVQLAAARIGWARYIEKPVVAGISALSLDILIACAIGTMTLATLGANLPALVILTLVAVVWSVFGALFLGPRIHGADWFEHALADFGQSQGNVATGFLLADMADPARSTNTASAYGYKQLTYEPLLGGGIISAMSVPMIVAWGTLTFGLVSLLITLALIGWGVARRRAGSVPGV
jgi:glutamate:Na+ symporter, ESS family